MQGAARHSEYSEKDTERPIFGLRECFSRRDSRMVFSRAAYVYVNNLGTIQVIEEEFWMVWPGNMKFNYFPSNFYVC